MKDNIEIICKNYNPTYLINWKNKNLDCNSNTTLYLAKLFNPMNNQRAYFLSLYLLADERKEKFTLMVRGNLNYWYYQKISEKNLTIKQHEYCLDLIFTVLLIEENEIIDSEITDFRIKLTLINNKRRVCPKNHQKIL